MLDDPRRNKGTAFTAAKRQRLGLQGLLPHQVETLDRQMERVMGHLDQKPSDIERYVCKLATAERPGDLRAWIEAMLYKPEYRAEA